MLAALLDYVWVRVNNMKMAHEVTTKSKDLNIMRKYMRWVIITVGVIQRKFTRKIGQKKQQQQIKDTAKATIMIKKIRETQKKHKTWKHIKRNRKQ